jgi:PhzF family phenazine biosynthesis protein
VQECGVGLVELRSEERIAFAAPDLIRGGEVDEETLGAIAKGLQISRDEIRGARWCDNGPGWVGVILADAEAVLAVTPDHAALGNHKVGVVGCYPEGSECAVEVRAYFPADGVAFEDPVTGSLNAALGQWLAGSELPDAYVASQGTVMKRKGRVHVDRVEDQVWVGGDTLTTIRGTVEL